MAQITRPISLPAIRIPTPTSWEESSDDTGSLEAVSYHQPMPEELPTDVMKVWEHFYHSMPLNSDRRAWKQFLNNQDVLDFELQLKNLNVTLFKTDQSQEKQPQKKRIDFIDQKLFRCMFKTCDKSFTRLTLLKKHVYHEHRPSKK